jgi:hypothetical protein
VILLDEFRPSLCRHPVVGLAVFEMQLQGTAEQTPLALMSPMTMRATLALASSTKESGPVLIGDDPHFDGRSDGCGCRCHDSSSMQNVVV